MQFETFEDDLRAVVVGASGGIGGAFTRALAGSPQVGGILACARSGEVLVHDKVDSAPIDLLDEGTIAAAAETAARRFGALDLVLVGTGVLHDQHGLKPEKTWRALHPMSLARAFEINATGPALVAKHFLPLLARERKSVFAAVSARVGSIEDNRYGGWHAYRSSKAALNMLIRTFSIELARRNPGALCVALHPGTVDTALSAPFQANVPASRLFTPDQAAERLLTGLDRLTPADSGGLFAWDGERLPY